MELSLIPKLFAGLLVAVCVLLLLRMLISERRRRRLDEALRIAAERLQRFHRSVRRRWRAFTMHRASHRYALREAEAAIRRARQTAAGRSQPERDGNVDKPDSLRDQNRKLH